ncbi:MAG: MMPL family transporter, partial [Proteobacteria bacterium]|nr:MMPL family transporter [Pseudomonadota bacterium]
NFRAEFGSDDGVFIVYKPKDGDVFSRKSLQAVQGLREELLNFRMRLKEGETSTLEHVTRIDTLVNASILKSEHDSLVSGKLVGRTVPEAPEELEAIRRTAVAQKSFPLLYFSKDYQYGGIRIETDFGAILKEAPSGTDAFESEDEVEGEGEFTEEDDEIDMEVDETATVEKVEFQTTEMGEYLGLMEEIWKVLGKSKYADHLEYYPIGNAPMMEFGKEILAEMTIMYPAMLIIMLFLLFFLFRSFSAVLWPILVVVLSSVWTVGLAGWAGITITTMLMLTVMLILAVGTADSIHILSGYLYFHSGGHDHEDAVRLAYRKSGLACMLTSLTTMAGMLALTLTRISHIQVFGFMSALGVGMAFLFTIYLLPAMLDLWAP